MWSCDCDGDGNYSHKTTLYKTRVDKDHICIRCGHYAVWVDNPINRLKDEKEDPVTLYKVDTGETAHFYNLEDAYKWGGFVSPDYLAATLRRDVSYYKRNKVFAMRGFVEDIQEKCRKALKGYLVYAYNKTDGKKVAEGCITLVKDLVGVNESTIRHNLERPKIKNRKNLYYTKDYLSESEVLERVER